MEVAAISTRCIYVLIELIVLNTRNRSEEWSKWTKNSSY